MYYSCTFLVTSFSYFSRHLSVTTAPRCDVFDQVLCEGKTQAVNLTVKSGLLLAVHSVVGMEHPLLFVWDGI
jgi:hypothetical protein